MPDVGSALDDTAADAGRERREPFRGEDGARVVLVAGGGRALGVVRPAHDRRHGEGERDRQVSPGERKPSEEGEARPRKREVKAPGGLEGRRGEEAADTGRRESVGDHHGEEHGRERAGEPPREADPPEQRDQDDAEGDEAHDRVGQDLQHRQQADERDPGPADRAEKRGPRHGAPHRVASQGEARLDEAEEDRHRHPHLPREHGVARRQVGRAQDSERHPEDARRVDPERHRGDVVASRAAGEAPRHREIDEVPDEDPDGRARDHPVEDDLAGKMERADEDGGQDDQVRHVVEHQREERVGVPRAEEARTAHGRVILSCRSPEARFPR